jgi:hypothetical protein
MDKKEEIHPEGVLEYTIPCYGVNQNCEISATAPSQEPVGRFAETGVSFTHQ